MLWSSELSRLPIAGVTWNLGLSYLLVPQQARRGGFVIAGNTSSACCTTPSPRASIPRAIQHAKPKVICRGKDESIIALPAQSELMSLVCMQCGASYPMPPGPTELPELCIMCADERGSLDRDGQKWTTTDDLHQAHKNVLQEEEPGILSIGVQPAFGVGQRALFIQTGIMEYRCPCFHSRCCVICRPESDLNIYNRATPHF